MGIFVVVVEDDEDVDDDVVEDDEDVDDDVVEGEIIL